MGRVARLLLTLALTTTLLPAGAATAASPGPTTAARPVTSGVASGVASAVSSGVPVGSLAPGGAVVLGPDRLVMQHDGNLVLYRSGRAAWHTATNGNPGARFAAQGDGNLVVYAPGGRPLWNSRTAGAGARDLRLEGGRLSLRSPSGRPVWQDGRWLADTLPAGAALHAGEFLLASRRAHRLVLQGDGNLVLYRSDGAAVWSSRTVGSGADALRMQGDGNLVLYARSTAVWHTATSGAGGRLVLQDDGNAVLYGPGGARWDSSGHTGRTARRLLPPFASSVSAVTQAELGPSYRSGCPVPPSSLRRVRVSYVGFDGVAAAGDLVVRHDVAAATVEVFRRLYEQRFPVRRMVPVAAYGGSDEASMAADNTSAFNCRAATGGSGWSEHSYGLAVDVNPVENPYVRGATVLPAAGSAYLDRSRVRPGMVTPAVVAAFAAGGFSWGGSWSSAKDYQHFSTTGR